MAVLQKTSNLPNGKSSVFPQTFQSLHPNLTLHKSSEPQISTINPSSLKTEKIHPVLGLMLCIIWHVKCTKQSLSIFHE